MSKKVKNIITNNCGIGIDTPINFPNANRVMVNVCPCLPPLIVDEVMDQKSKESAQIH
jgi:hypothetical protein